MSGLAGVRNHVEAIERWDADAYAYSPSEVPYGQKTRACPVCGSPCHRTAVLCETCYQNGRREICEKGHDLTDPVIRYVEPDGGAYCRICKNDRQARYRRARRLANRNPQETA